MIDPKNTNQHFNVVHCTVNDMVGPKNKINTLMTYLTTTHNMP